MKTADSLAAKLETLGKLYDIVRNMKALSSANVNQYERAVNALGEYYRTIEMGLHVVLEHLPEPPPKTHSRTKTKRVAAVIFGSDYGLCGRFNQNLCDYALQRMDTLETPAESRLILAVGSKADEFLQEVGQPVQQYLFTPSSADGITETVSSILLTLDAWKEERDVEQVWLFYNRRSSKTHYLQTALPLLPLDKNRLIHRAKDAIWPSKVLPTFSMPAETLLSRLVHQYLFVALFRACAESLASEHSARLIAMQMAEKNIGDTLDETLSEHRRMRQELITAEILDVVAGYEASDGENH